MSTQQKRFMTREEMIECDPNSHKIIVDLPDRIMASWSIFRMMFCRHEPVCIVFNLLMLTARIIAPRPRPFQTHSSSS